MFGVTLYQPTYILPFYFTQTPDQAIYQGNTPLNQRVQSQEFKSQLSFLVPVWRNIANKPLSLNIGYTQLSYWQFYSKSQYFRETNYEPEMFLTVKPDPRHEYDLGVVHQSNGRGGTLERSWNRVYVEYKLFGPHWMIAVKPWVLIFQGDSSDLDNPDISRYLGHEWVIGAYKFRYSTVALKLRNTVDSGFSRGAEELDWTIPIHSHFNFFVQLFSGYGQSLIEYNHYTNSAGVGIALNNWF